MSDLPASQRAEESVLGALLSDPETAPMVIGTILQPEHFYYRPYRAIYEQLVEAYYAEEAMDAISIAESIGQKAATLWSIEKSEAVDRIIGLTRRASSPDAVGDHARVVKRHADYRELLKLADRLRESVEKEEEDPELIAGAISTDAMRVATDSLVRSEVFSYGELGQRWTRGMRQVIAAREAGVELGAFFKIPALDDYMKGLRPTELCIGGGEPGVGKSAVWWKAGENFARRQAQVNPDKPIGTLIISGEMGEEPSSTRLAQSVSSIDGEKLRLGTLTRMELRGIAERWAADKDLPIYVAHPSMLRISQLRAICAEEIRRHNVGLVIIDHFKMLRPDGHFNNASEADDEVVLQLKMGLAKDLNLAVICIAHTVKSIERADKRPKMNDLRGSGMISAFADFVCFVYRPWKHASEVQRERGLISRNDAEVIWDKSRHTGEGTGELFLNLATMDIG